MHSEGATTLATHALTLIDCAIIFVPTQFLWLAWPCLFFIPLFYIFLDACCYNVFLLEPSNAYRPVFSPVAHAVWLDYLCLSFTWHAFGLGSTLSSSGNDDLVVKLLLLVSQILLADTHTGAEAKVVDGWCSSRFGEVFAFALGRCIFFFLFLISFSS